MSSLGPLSDLVKLSVFFITNIILRVLLWSFLLRSHDSRKAEFSYAHTKSKPSKFVDKLARVHLNFKIPTLLSTLLFFTLFLSFSAFRGTKVFLPGYEMLLCTFTYRVTMHLIAFHDFFYGLWTSKVGYNI